jgi:hypothetical protein
MTYYMILLKNELHVVPVQPEEDIDFFQLHGQRILASGDCIPEVLRKFNALPVIFDTTAKHP